MSLRKPPQPARPEPLVMLVDDDQAIAEMYAVGLANSGFRVETLSDAAEFFEALDRDIPDAVVLDWEMPAISGGDILRLLRRDERTLRLPVVFLSNHARDDVASVEGDELAWLVKEWTTPARLVGALRAALATT